MITYHQAIKGAKEQVLYSKVELGLKNFLKCHNLKVTDFGLRGLGEFFEHPFDQEAVKVVYADSNGVYVVAKDGLYLNKDLVLSFDKQNGCCVLYNKLLIFSCKGFGTYAVTKKTTARLWVYGFDKMALSGGGVCGVENNTFHQSTAGETDQWRDVVRVNVPEECNSVAAEKGKAYVLGNTCYTFDPKAERIDSRFTPIAANVGKVYADSTVSFADCTLFASDNGLYKLQNGNVKKVFDGLNLRFDGAVACAFAGKYLVSCKRGDFSASNDITLWLNPETQRVDGVYEWGFDSLYSNGGEVYGVREGKLFKHYDLAGKWHFESEKIDMGSKKLKFLDAVELSTRNTVRVTVIGDQTAMVIFYGGASVEKQPIRLSGKEFTVVMESDVEFDSENLALTAHRPKEAQP